MNPGTIVKEEAKNKEDIVVRGVSLDKPGESDTGGSPTSPASPPGSLADWRCKHQQ
jgi:hypothetical protein